MSETRPIPTDDPFAMFRGQTRSAIIGFLLSLAAGKDAHRHPPILLFTRNPDRATADNLHLWSPANEIALRGRARYDSEGRYTGTWWDVDACADRILAAMAQQAAPTLEPRQAASVGDDDAAPLA